MLPLGQLITLTNAMRLLRTQGNELTLEEFLSVESAPPYACLSHRWQGQEVTFQDLQNPSFKLQTKDLQRSWQKILNARRAALQLGYGYVWIDSCCIDQKSSAELTESINSMYLWYEKSACCIAFLSDDHGSKGSFRRSQWWLRGWTLQELLAPKELMFYDATWAPRITRSCAAAVVEEITGIEQAVLQRPSREALRKVCAATKLSWAAKRSTTKVEDRAYSLLGLFEIQLPIFYGEGLEQALWRLQVEIYRSTSDYTIFAWEQSDSSAYASFAHLPMIATQLELFDNHRKLRRTTYAKLGLAPEQVVPVAQHYSDRVHGLRVQFLMKVGPKWRDDGGPTFGQCILPCVDMNDNEKAVVFPVLVFHGTTVFRAGKTEVVSKDDLQSINAGEDLRLFDMFFTSFLQNYSLSDDHNSSLLASTVHVSDKAITSPEGLGLGRSNNSVHDSQAWETEVVSGDKVEWSYFEEFEGSLCITISSLPRRMRNSDEASLTISVKVDRWRLLDVNSTDSISRDRPTTTPLLIENGAPIEESPHTIAVPWLDGRIIRVAYRTARRMLDIANESTRLTFTTTAHVDLTVEDEKT